ncbi:MAG: tRNA pseudouridine(55) synthase TruB [Acidobacteria bacterium]|nr:tRNA pseudouridine(55) synthase TruB [Acidobacteriota bacterium]
MDGAVVLDKPRGMTSHDAVVIVRRMLAEPRVGHLGTLDPLATGVLVLLLGTATRLAQFYGNREKEYEGVIRFGFSTDTFDGTGRPTSAQQAVALGEPQLRSLFQEFLGTRLQQPPPFSAKKVSGVPAYRLARKGRSAPLKAVPVTIHELRLLSVEGDLAQFRARVSAGTYIRSLAHELGQRLGTGAHLAELRRTAVGEFTLAQAVSLEQLQEQVHHETSWLIPLAELLPEIPAVALSNSTAEAASHGNDVQLDAEAPWIKLLDGAGRLLAIAERRKENWYHPLVVLSARPVKNGMVGNNAAL